MQRDEFPIHAKASFLVHIVSPAGKGQLDPAGRWLREQALPAEAETATRWSERRGAPAAPWSAAGVNLVETHTERSIDPPFGGPAIGT